MSHTLLDIVESIRQDFIKTNELRDETLRLSRASGVDTAPEGGCALGVLELLVREKRIPADAEVLVFNTGSGASYRF